MNTRGMQLVYFILHVYSDVLILPRFDIVFIVRDLFLIKKMHVKSSLEKRRCNYISFSPI